MKTTLFSLSMTVFFLLWAAPVEAQTQTLKGKPSAIVVQPSKGSNATGTTKSKRAPRRRYSPFVEGKWAHSPKGQLVAYVRVPDRGPTELWVRHTKDGSPTLLRRGYLGIQTKDIRRVRVSWQGNLIRLHSPGRTRYFDLRGRQVSILTSKRTVRTIGKLPFTKKSQDTYKDSKEKIIVETS